MPTLTDDGKIITDAEKIVDSARAELERRLAVGGVTDLPTAALLGLVEQSDQKAQAEAAQRRAQDEAKEKAARDAKVEDLAQAIAQIDPKQYKDTPELQQGIKALKRGLTEGDSRIKSMLGALVDTQLYNDNASTLEKSKGDGTGLRRLEVVGKDGKILDTAGGKAFKAIIEHASDHARVYEDLQKASSQEISADLAAGNELVKSLRKFSFLPVVNKLLGHYDKALLAEDVLNGVRGEGAEKISVDAMLGKFMKNATSGGLSLDSVRELASNGHESGLKALGELCKPAAGFLETVEGTLGNTVRALGNSGLVKALGERIGNAGEAIGGKDALSKVTNFVAPRGQTR